MLALYRLATDLGGPAINMILARRRARGKEDAARLPERQGIPGRPRPEGRLVWLHGASVGESMSALPLIERLVAGHPKLNVLVTTGTVTSAALLAERLPGRAFHQYVPVDRTAWVRRFLDHWRPDAALWMESEFWPNLILETAARDIPMVLLNGRMSDRSFRRWSGRRGTIKKILSRFALCLAQSDADRERFAALGAADPQCFGNLKYAAPPLPHDQGELAALRKAVRGRPLWLAASTHRGEEDMVMAAHRTLAVRHKGLFTILAPRHPVRGDEIAEAVETAGLGLARRGAGQAIGRNTALYLADTMGELGLFYRLAKVVFVGGSLTPDGGHNLIEPAQLDCAILHGPHMTNFRTIAAQMQAADATAEVASADGLAKAVDRLLREPDLRQQLAKAARRFAQTKHGVLDRIVGALGPHLPFLLTPRKTGAAPKGKPRARA